MFNQFPLEALLKKVSSPNSSQELYAHNLPPILFAAQHGKIAEIRVLLSNGESIETEDQCHGFTALFFAAQNNNIHLTKFLIDNKINVHHKNKRGRTALFFAGMEKNTVIAQLLLQAGAKINEEDVFQETPLFFAARHGQIDFVRFLLAHGATPEHCNITGDTAFSVASTEEIKAIISEYLPAKTDKVLLL